MTDHKLFLIDTNLLIYAYEKEHSIKKKKAQELIESCLRGKIKLAVSNQNLAEFAHVVTKKGKLTFEQANASLYDILNFDGFIKLNYSADTVLLAAEIAGEHKMSFWDSLIAATMKENNIFNIYTENIKDFKIPWLNPVNPIK